MMSKLTMMAQTVEIVVVFELELFLVTVWAMMSIDLIRYHPQLALHFLTRFLQISPVLLLLLYQSEKRNGGVDLEEQKILVLSKMVHNHQYHY